MPPCACQPAVGLHLGLLSAKARAPPNRPAPWCCLLLSAGTRLLGLVVGDLAMPLQSPAVRLATQSALLFLTSNTGGYCGTQLLRHPLSLERMRWLAEGLNHLSLPLLSMMPCSPRSMWLPQPGEPAPGCGPWGARSAGSAA